MAKKKVHHAKKGLMEHMHAVKKNRKKSGKKTARKRASKK